MRETGSGRRKEGRQKEMTPYIIVFMISIGLFALSDRVKFTQRKPVVLISNYNIVFASWPASGKYWYRYKSLFGAYF